MKRREFIQNASAIAGGVALENVLPLGRARAADVQPERPFDPSLIPSLDDLSGEWIETAKIEQTPALSNFRGSLLATRNLLGILDFTLPPYSQGVEMLNVSFNGVPVVADEFRWSAYQVGRRARLDGWELSSTVRMPFEQEGILFEFEAQNSSSEPKMLTICVNAMAPIEQFEDTWTYHSPRPAVDDRSGFQTAIMGSDDDRVYLTHDWEYYAAKKEELESSCTTAIAFLQPPSQTAQSLPVGVWNKKMNPAERFVVQGVLAVGKTKSKAVQLTLQWKNNYAALWTGAKQNWEKRWLSVFDPDGGHFSGNLPTLVTPDQKLRRLYYGSVLSMIVAERTNFGEQYPRLFVSSSPRCANAAVYFWDAMMYGTLWALLDPAQMREHLRLFLSSDIHACYAIDYQSMKPIGPWYSANDYATFRLVTTYVFSTRDLAFLEEPIRDGKKVIDYLEEMALYFKKLATPPRLLANYGDASNLLEAVSTYVECVPSLNAANVWMLRSLAEIREHRGETARAVELRQLADELAAEILTLYVEGGGYWNCRMHDGNMVAVRHCIDFFTTISAMQEDLGQARIARMIQFADEELWTPHWLRALSLNDAEAANSPRPDHGSTGSFDAWPALTAEAYFLIGRKTEAIARLQSVEPALCEGPFGQAHVVATAEYPVRKALYGGMDYQNAITGCFAEVIVRTIFGFSPTINAPWNAAREPIPGFSGTLRHVRYEGRSVEIVV